MSNHSVPPLFAATSSASRRWFLQRSAFAAATLATPGLMAEVLTQTPASTEGPFYPDRLPLDTDNDLLVLNDKSTFAVGDITHLGGRILSAAGEPVRGATIEIWQVDGRGVYLHSRSSGQAKRDHGFQGYGRFLTSSSGEYYFRTVKPVTYPGRTPHIHFTVRRGDRKLLTSQLYVAGEQRNQRDGLYRRLGDRAAAVTAEFKPVEDSTRGELQVNFDIVLGNTPSDKPA